MADLNEITELDYLNRVTERMIVSDDGEVHVKRTQRCDPVLEAVHAARDLPKGSKMRHAASVPLVLYHKWMIEAGIRPGEADTTRKMTEVIKKKIASNEYARLMVHGF
jgi:hypothetical protein